MWTVFDNGGGRAQAALEFLQWLTDPEQIKQEDLATGHLPIRLSVAQDASFIGDFAKTIPGVDVFAANLANVEQARPVLAAYPQISEAMGLAIVSALLGEKDSKAALDEAAAQATMRWRSPGRLRRVGPEATPRGHAKRSRQEAWRTGGSVSAVPGLGSRRRLGLHPALGDPDRRLRDPPDPVGPDPLVPEGGPDLAGTRVGGAQQLREDRERPQGAAGGR
jgi:hypothetical protein